MNQWTNDTATIIAAHQKDFNKANYSAKMSACGGYSAYVKSLGGVFQKLYGDNTPPTTVQEFRQHCEFVQGLMAIWGFDYNNGKHYYKWGNGSSDRFYSSGGSGKCNGGTITQLCQGTGGRGRTTNCNYGIDTLLRHMGLYKKGSDAFTSWATKYGKPVAAKASLKPGDMVHFFNKSVTRTKVSTWKGKGWKHIAIVHTVDKANKKIWLADFGSRFITSKKPLHYMPINTSALAGGEYTGYWAAIHAFNFREAEDKEEDVASSLVNYVKTSPNSYGNRNHAIDTITPHCVVGQLSVETLGELFAKPSYQASSNYGIGSDGRVGLYVPENRGSWCSSSITNDMRAITIECASDATAPYAFNDIVYNKLITLCTDICRRYGKTKLIWFGDKGKTLSYAPKSNEMVLTVHRWFAQKACPGDWMMAHMQELAETVTNRLNPEEVIPIPKTIKMGSKGKLVKWLQIYLGSLTVDGYFGSKTRARLIAWQKAKGVAAVGQPDGVCGKKCWTYILKSMQ